MWTCVVVEEGGVVEVRAVATVVVTAVWRRGGGNAASHLRTPMRL